MGASVALTGLVGWGFPDWVLGFRGINVLVELKKPGAKLRPNQEKFRRTWKGLPVAKVENHEDVVKLLLGLDRMVPLEQRTMPAADETLPG